VEERLRKSLFCFGLGYSAMVLAARLIARGWRVAGTARDGERIDELRALGIEAYAFSTAGGAAALAPRLDGATHVLSSIPPGEQGEPVLDALAVPLCEAASLEWVGYLSTTGVYGTRDGGWVDESSELKPSSERSRRRVEAERAWLRLQRDAGLPVHVFRLAGIYGPGRNVIKAVRAGTAKRIDLPGQVFSRIHVEDIASVLEASIARPNPGAIYNVCDDEPAEPARVIAYACGLLGQPVPPLVPFAQADLSAMARSFYLDNKRVSNRRLHEELGVSLAYPNYKAGLDALYAAGE
jgi:nucleoside-diphosphate-sugar epimerase